MACSKAPTALLGAKRDFEVWTYDSDNSTQINCFIPVKLVLFELGYNKYIVFNSEGCFVLVVQFVFEGQRVGSNVLVNWSPAH